MINQDDQKRKELAQKKHTSEKSAQILEKLEKKKLGEIFAILDSDEDGTISQSKMDLDRPEERR